MSYSRREDKSHGYIDWPDCKDNRPPRDEETGWYSSNEGGMSVYAWWASVESEVCIPHIQCMFRGLSMDDDVPRNIPYRHVMLRDESGDYISPAEVLHWTGHERKLYIDSEEVADPTEFFTLCRGFLYLGSSGLSPMWFENGEYEKAFVADRSHLTDEGEEFLSSIEEHYGTKANFITFLDT